MFFSLPKTFIKIITIINHNYKVVMCESLFTGGLLSLSTTDLTFSFLKILTFLTSDNFYPLLPLPQLLAAIFKSWFRYPTNNSSMKIAHRFRIIYGNERRKLKKFLISNESCNLINNLFSRRFFSLYPRKTNVTFCRRLKFFRRYSG